MTNLWSNVKFFAMAGVGLFGDGYLNITIGLVVPMIGYLYFPDEDSEVPTVSSDVIKGGLSVSPQFKTDISINLIHQSSSA